MASADEAARARPRRLPGSECASVDNTTTGLRRRLAAVEPGDMRSAGAPSRSSQSVVFRSARGSKFTAVLLSGQAAFEIDGTDPCSGNRLERDRSRPGRGDHEPGRDSRPRATRPASVGAWSEAALDPHPRRCRIRPADRAVASRKKSRRRLPPACCRLRQLTGMRGEQGGVRQLLKRDFARRRTSSECGEPSPGAVLDL
jgi:hypothetical protein